MKPLIVAPALLFLFYGCSKIPPAAPELSTAVGKQLDGFEAANLTLLSRFFDLKRAQIDRFMEETWIPSFTETYFTDPAIASAWETIVTENDPKQRAQFIIRVGTQLQARINKKRAELVAPLDELERTIAQNLRDRYSQTKTLNNTLTGLLSSAAEVTANRERYLAMAGIDDTQTGNLIDKTDKIVSTFLTRSEQTEAAEKQIATYLDRLKSVTNSLKKDNNAD